MITPKQYAQCLKAANGSQRKNNQPIKDVMRFIWHTGARPQEFRIIEAAWVDDRKIVFPKDQSKGKRKRRVIYLNPTAATIVARLSHQYPEGPIFRNSRGEPWKKCALTLAFRRIRERTEIAGLCPYAFRHSFITRQLEKGIDVATVAALAGHTPRMTLSAYNHVCQNESRLLDKLCG